MIGKVIRKMADAEEKKGRLRKRIFWLGIVLAVLLAAGGIAYFVYSLYRNSYGTFGSYKVIKEVERADGTSAKYAGYNGLLLKYSRDGATVLDSSGEFLWNGSYEMQDPIYDSCGEYVVIGDRGGKQVHIFNGDGAVKDITVDYPILQVQISKQGTTAVMMEEKNVVYVDLYAADGTALSTAEYPIVLSGFPLWLTISEDGQRYLYSALDISTGTVKTNTGMRSFNEVGQNEINNFVGGITFEGTAVKVDFITNDVVVIYTDNGCYLYKMVERPSEKPIAEITFETPIQSVFSGPSYVGFVVDSNDENNRYQVVVYDLNGKKILDRGINFDYTDIQVNDQEIIFYNYSGCLIINTAGTVRYQGQFADSVEGIFGISKNKYYLVKGNKIEIIQLRGDK